MAAQTLSGLSPQQAIARAEQVLGYEFADKALLEAALTHPSVADASLHAHNYERLEFLGDSILGAIIAEWLFERFPDVEEGGLTRIKVSLVAGSTLSQVASEQGLGDAIVFGESETGSDRRGLHSALENVYEAVVAALYLDGGIAAAKRWVLATLTPHVDVTLAAKPENPKSSLQELLQAHQKHPEYQITGTDGPPHNRTFHAQALVDGRIIGQGSGHSKKEAEAAAARQALEAYAAEQGR